MWRVSAITCFAFLRTALSKYIAELLLGFVSDLPCEVDSFGELVFALHAKGLRTMRLWRMIRSLPLGSRVPFQVCVGQHQSSSAA